MTDTVIRRAGEADLAAITAIYNHYIENTAVTFDLEPLHWHDRQDWLAGFDSAGRHQLFVAVEDDNVLGYAYSGVFRARAAYRRSVETSVYLKDGEAGGGLGSALYTALFDALGREDVHRAFAGIALPNDASVALHEKFGFSRVGVFSDAGWKFERYHDVLWMEKTL